MYPIFKYLSALFYASSLAFTAFATETSFKFDFGVGQAPAGYIAVGPDCAYDVSKGYGLEPGPRPQALCRSKAGTITNDFLCSENSPFLFSVLLPEGNYRVHVVLGDPEGKSNTTIKAESRRLMIEQARTDKGIQRTEIFTVNIRRPNLTPPEKNAPGLTQVQLNERELKVYHWDEKLTLEFNGPRACVAALEICAAPEATPTVFLIGDSTVTDQPGEPAAGWGQMLPRFFSADIAIANHAESGETLKSFMTAGRLAKVLEQLKAGDYLFIQFGHNDSKNRWPQTYAAPDSTFPAYLKAVIAEARLRRAHPVLLTSMHRRKFDANGKVIDTHGAYPPAVRKVAAEEQIPLIDLHTLSEAFYEKLGATGSAVAFTDGTHHSNYGGYELAKIVVSEIQRQMPSLAAYLRCGSAPEPFIMDDPATWSIPSSPSRLTAPPRGN